MRVRMLKGASGPHLNDGTPVRPGHCIEVNEQTGRAFIAAKSAVEVSEHAESCPAFDENSQTRVLAEAAKVEEANRVAAHRAAKQAAK